ncbi:MAG: hypothetical protein WC565_05660 [Parcubacteria group bacterium]
MVRMRFALALALALVLAGAVSADNTYMPVAQETGGMVIRAHVAWQDWRPFDAGLSGYCVAAYDEDGALLGMAETDGEGDAVFDVQPHSVITLRLSGDAIEPMQVTVTGSGALAVAFWAQTRYSAGEHLVATNWERVER